jgi:hypothetical protein
MLRDKVLEVVQRKPPKARAIYGEPLDSVITLAHEQKFVSEIMAGATGLEPATFGVTGRLFI